MIIRDVYKEDEQQFIEMCRDFYSTDAVLLPMDVSKIKKTFQEAINGSPYLRLVFLINENQTIGYSLFAFYWSNEAGGLVAQIEELYVLPEHRGQKYGHKFFDWCLDSYKDKVARFRLEACKSNKGALKLYESYGFEVLPYIQMIYDQSSAL